MKALDVQISPAETEFLQIFRQRNQEGHDVIFGAPQMERIQRFWKPSLMCCPRACIAGDPSRDGWELFHHLIDILATEFFREN
jgi:hypothetical protein